ncbi:MAG: hypothetical protein JWP75_3758 [Frondihabitans sp.]|nr:hypothetical protein [Frondihabitans sp.]
MKQSRVVAAIGAACFAATALALTGGLPANATAVPAASVTSAAHATSMPIPETDYKVTDFDSQSAPYPAPPSLDGTAQASIDGDYGTEWSSAYNNGAPAAMPHWLTVDVGQKYDITGIQYAVKNQGNGPIQKYAVYVTNNATAATNGASTAWGAPAATGSFVQPTSNTQLQSVIFAHPIVGRYVKLVALSSINGSANASIGELRVLAAGSTSNPLYSVSSGTQGTFANPDDTAASLFIDKNGTFHYSEAAADYGSTAPRAWSFYTGSNFDTATADTTLDNAVNPANPSDKNSDTTERCNNSPTGLTSTFAPVGSGYSQRNFCDLTQIWVDPDTGNWYGLVHNEFTPQPFGDGLHYDAIDFAESTNQGLRWTIEGHAITSPYSTTRGDTTAFPQATYDYGDGDPRLYVDTASGYFYVYYGSRIVDKDGGWTAFYEHAARAPIADKMATGSWQKWYDGTWSQPGTGGKESNVVPVGATSTTGYTAPADEYNPTTPGSATQQIIAGKTPPTSPLFVMDVTYDAYLGLYISEPQNPDQSGNEPQQYYATKSLATQKWFLLGDSGSSFTTASWYRWFVDSANITSSSIVGKTFRSYCAYSCEGGVDGDYANVTVDTTAPASLVNARDTYRIGAANGLALTQVGQTKTGTFRGKPSTSAQWRFTSNGDGSYTVTNVKSGKVLSVNSTTTKGRAWGTAPTVASSQNGNVGQQWFAVANTSSATGARLGTFRLVNRYSGLVLGLSTGSASKVTTTPARTWNSTGKTTAGSLPLVADQVLSFTPVSRR